MTNVALDESFDRIILGQNQFFGVNHISDRKAIEREQYFSDVKNVIRLLEEALELGITGFTITTHPRTPEILDEIRRNPTLKSNLNLYPGVPDPGKLMRMFAELGPMKTIQTMIGKTKITKKLNLLFTGAGSLLCKDYLGLLKTLIDVELAPFYGLNVRGVFLTNNVNDLGLGLDMKEVFVMYYEYLTQHVGTVPAFNTTVLPFHLEKMQEYGLPNLPVMAAINKAGFYVNPSVDAFRTAAQNYDARIVAMSTLASGLYTPAESYEFVFNCSGIESITVGASTRAHLKDAVDEINRFSSKFR